MDFERNYLVKTLSKQLNMQNFSAPPVSFLIPPALCYTFGEEGEKFKGSSLNLIKSVLIV
jgi:hypothetical protein